MCYAHTLENSKCETYYYRNLYSTVLEVRVYQNAKLFCWCLLTTLLTYFARIVRILIVFILLTYFARVYSRRRSLFRFDIPSTLTFFNPYGVFCRDFRFGTGRSQVCCEQWMRSSTNGYRRSPAPSILSPMQVSIACFLLCSCLLLNPYNRYVQ